MLKGFFVAKTGYGFAVVSETARDVYGNPISFTVENGQDGLIVKETLGGLEGIEEERELLEIKAEVSRKLSVPFDGKFLYWKGESVEEGVRELFPVCLTVVDAWKMKAGEKVKLWEELQRKLRENPFSAVKLRRAREIAELFDLQDALPVKRFGNKAFVETENLFRAVGERLIAEREIKSFVSRLSRDREEIEKLLERLTKTAGLLAAFLIDGRSQRRTTYSIYLLNRWKELKKWLKGSSLKGEVFSLLERNAEPKELKRLIKGAAVELT